MDSNLLDVIPLELEQQELLAKFVEAVRNTPRSKRASFDYMATEQGDFIFHPGLPRDARNEVHGPDIEILAAAGMIHLSYGRRGISSFDVRPLGFKYYEQMKLLAGEPIRRVESTVRQYLDTEQFRKRYPDAFQKWSDAEMLLWGSDSQGQLTTIGHSCREAIQEFVSTLVDIYQPSGVDLDKAHTKNRIGTVISLKRDQLGTTEQPFLDALYAYFEAIEALIQRQEHGAQKEGEPLVWKDARRVVFQTMIVMYELDQALNS